jgi:hypothetical protein
MPFHVGGHKPRALKHSVSGIKQRLTLVAMGAVCLALGLFRLSRGVLFVVNWHAMPMYSGAVIAMGSALILLAMIPLSWLETVFHWLDSDRRR